MASRVNYSGLVIAGLGFFLTRFTVSLAVYEDPVRFYLAGVVPLALGLGLAAFGVALAVADVDAALVRTTALWCVVGAGTMLVLVVLTLLGSTGDMTDFGAVRSQTYLANFLIGGSVGGTLTGLYASRNRRQRDALEQQANRLETLNRLLRHEVLNATAVIRGYAATGSDLSAEASDVIVEYSDGIAATIEEVKHLTRSAGTVEGGGTPVDLAACLDASAATVSDRHDGTSVAVGTVPDALAVRANERLEHVFTHLLENAVVHADDDAPEVAVTATETTARVTVRDDGDGLPESQRALLERGDIDEFDNAGTGFGLNVVRLLVESYGGDVDTRVDDAGTAVTVALPRARSATAEGPEDARALAGVRPALPHLLVAVGAALLAGVFYGVVSRALDGSIASIGVFYGTADPVVGWITHEFHSVVFGLVFVSLLTLAPRERRGTLSTHLAGGAAWSLVLWIVAAGVVAPVWLRLLGIPAPLPNLSLRSLATHLTWGVSLGLLTALGDAYVTAPLARLLDPFARRLDWL